MGILQDFVYCLTHWSFGLFVLISLVASEYTGAETVICIFVAAIVSILSGLCSYTTSIPQEQYRKKKFTDVLEFLILWLDILTNLVAAATCARLASATVDYISKGHFREFLFGMEQHSLGEPWPDVLGVTIIVVVTILFMLGLEGSHTISVLVIVTLLCGFVFFTITGSLYTVINFKKWCESFKVHTFRRVLKAASKCFYGFVHIFPRVNRNGSAKMFAIIFTPLIIYTTTAIIFSMMTHHKELVGTAIPLVQIFESRDVDWARPIISACTIFVVCLLLIQILPMVYNAFVKLGSKEWRIFVPSIQYRTVMTGAPILAIFAAGSLSAILAFACPLAHLIKLLNTAALLKCALVSCQLVYNRYKPEINYDCLVHNTNVQYSKLHGNGGTPLIRSNFNLLNIKEKLRNWFKKKPYYIHKLGSPKNITQKLTTRRRRIEERECLLLDDYSINTLTVDPAEDTASEAGDESVAGTDDENSGSSTDIDIVVEEYKEGLKVATVGKFNENRRSTRITSLIVVICIIVIIISSICLALYCQRILNIYWPSILGLSISIIIITAMPQNSADKSKEAILPSIIFPLCNVSTVALSISLASTIFIDIWQGIVFWSLAGLLLFWRCDCCTCEGLFRSPKIHNQVNITPNTSMTAECNFKERMMPVPVTDTIYITR
ncbi:probable cationic amino acid transporter [Diorhabda carinulata]|uniref:probable cationic amino acid transporter n=1 Tax=Diorhabda carinulata TaxID=1163345 RepID=UPI0025A068B4|nr:probable cationic amino acid transporter [Diorhabda carinulata]